jgi:transcriptional regulator with XRE-family HTH domain
MAGKKAKVPQRSAGPVDIHVGERLRMARSAKKLSQSELGAQLGVSFQQIQKYEKGVNRVTLPRAGQIAKALGVPLEYFFQGLPQAGQSPKEGSALIQKILSDKDVLKLAEIMTGITDKAQRLALLDLARTVAKVA